MKKLFCTLLVLLMLPVWLFSCGKDPGGNPGTDTTADNKAEELLKDDRIVLVRDGVSLYNVIRPEKGIKASALLAGTIIDSVKAKCGVELGIAMDDADVTECEILIGDTNRPESKAAAEALDDTTFSITVSGKKIVIAAKNEVMLKCAVTYFLENYVDTVPAVDGVFSVVKDLEHKSSTEYIVFNKPAEGNFMVVYPQSERDYQVLASYGDGTLYNLEYMANTIYAKLKDKGAGVVISTDRIFGSFKEEWQEILVGITEREATKAVKATLDYNEYAIKVVGNDIVVTGLGYVTTKEAVETFLDMLDLFYDSSVEPCYRIPNDFSFKMASSAVESWPNAPKYTGGVLDSVTDAGNKSYVAVYSDTNETEYNSYLQTLADRGYSKYFENNMNGNLYTVYKTDAVVVGAYYIPYSSCAHIVVEDGYTTNLPEPESENVYTDRGIQSSITQMKLNNVTDSNGQCHIFRLSDGRFIVVDGGGNDTKDGKNDAENMLNLLLRLSDGEKPVIAAWFITHLHSDHYNVLLHFASNFKDKVTVERFIYNFTPDSIENANTQSTITKVENAMKTFKEAKRIRAHTGQKYYISNAEIEILFAPEMIYPNFITFLNDTSVVFTVTVYDPADRTKSAKTLITGDASPNSSKIMCNMYKEYLQCDVLQISHHGSYGCSEEFYTYTNPTKLAFMPVGITQQSRLTKQPENVLVGKLVRIVPHFQGTFTYNLPNG